MDRSDDLIVRLVKSLVLTHKLIKDAEFDGFVIPRESSEALHESMIQYHIAKNYLNMRGITLED